MANIEEINKAIAAHGVWKQRLRQAIDSGASEFTVENVQPDNRCDFGRWLNSLPVGDKSCEHWKNVQGLHARFHIEAARILNLAIQGNQQEAEKALAFDSQFANLSAMLTSSMVKWKAHLGVKN